MDFDQWFNQQGKEETETADSLVYATCVCGARSDYVSEDELLEGRWYANCNQWCTP